MKTNDMIKALRDLADACEDLKISKLLDEAADRIEDLDERISIMSEDDGKKHSGLMEE